VRDGTYPVTITFPDQPAEVGADGPGPIEVDFSGLEANEWTGRILGDFRPNPTTEPVSVVVVVEIDGQPHVSSALYDPTSVVELRGPRFVEVEQAPDLQR
jgi:hypothetical protein